MVTAFSCLQLVDIGMAVYLMLVQKENIGHQPEILVYHMLSALFFIMMNMQIGLLNHAKMVCAFAPFGRNRLYDGIQLIDRLRLTKGK